VTATIACKGAIIKNCLGQITFYFKRSLKWTKTFKTLHRYKRYRTKV